jgi:hypothetical protein
LSDLPRAVEFAESHLRGMTGPADPEFVSNILDMVPASIFDMYWVPFSHIFKLVLVFRWRRTSKASI